MENEASFAKKNGTQNVLYCVFALECVFKKFFCAIFFLDFNPLFKIKLNFLIMQASHLMGLLVCHYWCSILNKKYGNSLLSNYSLIKSNGPGLIIVWPRTGKKSMTYWASSGTYVIGSPLPELDTLNSASVWRLYYFIILAPNVYICSSLNMTPFLCSCVSEFCLP